MGSLKTYLVDRSGAAAVEFAIVGSTFILLSIGIIDFGRNFLILHQMNHIADQISRVLMLNPTVSSADLLAYARENWAGNAPETLGLSLQNQTINGVPSSRLELTYAITWIVSVGEGGTVRIVRELPAK
jgi:Flp pilus assembly protein TadG